MTDYGAAFRRCLLECDVGGLIALQELIAPYAPKMSPVEATVTMHIARVESLLPAAVTRYSRDWLADHGYVQVDGRWRRSDAQELKVFSDAVGIASTAHNRRLKRLIEQGMSDALLNAMAKGITEPQIQKEKMLAARSRIKLRERL